MQKKALVIIDIQNDITKNYKDIIGNINQAIDWAVSHTIPVVYIGMRIYQRAREPLSPIPMGQNWHQI